FQLRSTGNADPWSLLNVDANDTRVIGVTHYEWDAKLYEVPITATENLLDCMEMFLPLDYQLSIANNFVNGIDSCRTHGFAFAVSRYSWYGGSPPPSDDNVQTRSRMLVVDDFGRSIVTQYENDVFRNDDDICVENTFASPSGSFP